MSESDRDLFRTFLFDMIEGRHDRVSPVLDEDVVWHLPPFAKQDPMRGRDAVLKFLTEAPASFYEPGTMRIEPVEILAGDGFASCLATLRATTKHGMPYENRYGFFARLRQGRLTEVWELLDSAVLLEQMRARPASG